MHRVENRAALAWQQAPPQADIIQDQIAASVEAASDLPSEASQLSQLSSAGKRQPAAQPRENPLKGHPRYRCVQDLSRQITHPIPSRNFGVREISESAFLNWSLMEKVWHGRSYSRVRKHSRKGSPILINMLQLQLHFLVYNQ